VTNWTRPRGGAQLKRAQARREEGAVARFTRSAGPRGEAQARLEETLIKLKRRAKCGQGGFSSRPPLPQPKRPLPPPRLCQLVQGGVERRLCGHRLPPMRWSAHPKPS